jgi:O-antigen/teichoic acid export membrane protein
MLLTAGLLPYFAGNFGHKAVGEMRDAYATATRVLAFLVLPACFGMAALLPTLLPLIYGRAFAGAVPAATVVVLASGVGATASVGTTLVMAMDRSEVVFASGLACAVLAVAAGLTVIPAFGLMGAAWSRGAIQLAGAAMGGGYIFCRLHFPLPLFDLGRLLLAAAICGLAARLALSAATGLPSLLLAVAAGTVSYAVAVRLMRALHPRDADRLRVLCRFLPARARAVADLLVALLAAEPRPQAGFAAAWQKRSAGHAD